MFLSDIDNANVSEFVLPTKYNKSKEDETLSPKSGCFFYFT